MLRYSYFFVPVAAFVSLASLSASAGEQLLNLPSAPKAGRFVMPSDRVWPAKPGEADVCLWADDKFAAYSITIDDNCKPDHAWWMKLAEELDIKLTWFVITDKVDKDSFSGTWADYQKLADAGHSIQSHTTNHTSEKYKRQKDKGYTLSEAQLVHMYKDSLDLINSKLTNNVASCIAYPRGEAHIEVAKRYAIACRGTGGIPNVANKISYLCTNKGGGNKYFADVILTGESKQPKTPKFLVKRPDLRRAWNCALYHHIQANKPGSQVTAEAEEEVRYFASKKDVLWIDTFANVARYGQERDSATLKVTENTADKIAFDLTDQMDDKLFNFPLTVKIRLPDGWKTVKATQGGQSVEAKLVEHDGAAFALVKSVPDRGQTVLMK